MSTITLELPDKYIQVLERIARQRQISVDMVIAELLDAIAMQDELDDTYDVKQDPIYNITAHASEAPADLSQYVDHYLYGAMKQ